MNRRQFTFGALGAALAGLFVKKAPEPELPVETSGYLEVEPVASWREWMERQPGYVVSGPVPEFEQIPFSPRAMFAKVPWVTDKHCPPGRIYAISSEFFFPARIVQWPD